jgi:predicted NUDIX family NTP pyrophosphohydrolase
MEYESGDVANHDREVDSASWIPIDEALRRASYKGERDMIEKAGKRLTGGKDSQQG